MVQTFDEIDAKKYGQKKTSINTSIACILDTVPITEPNRKKNMFLSIAVVIAFLNELKSSSFSEKKNLSKSN